MLTKEQALDIIAAHDVIACTGQLDPLARRELDRLARRKEIAKWRGYWYPVAGANWGIGPLKTCFGTFEAKASLPCSST